MVSNVNTDDGQGVNIAGFDFGVDITVSVRDLVATYLTEFRAQPTLQAPVLLWSHLVVVMEQLKCHILRSRMILIYSDYVSTCHDL